MFHGRPPARSFLALIGLALLGLVAAGCAAPQGVRSSAGLPEPATLLTGVVLFGAPVSADELPDAEVRALDQDMRAFVAAAVAGTQSHDARLERLLHAMLMSGLFSLDYQSEMTLTAKETFHRGVGNCLAFTNLFVALAREARLRVQYQQVQAPAMWSGDAQTFVFNQHVNVLVRGVSTGRHTPRNQVIDFNQPDFRGRHPQRPISDAELDALFYNNLGAESLQEGAHRVAMVYFLKALRVHGDSPETWTNLGVLYRRHDHLEHAESAFHRALLSDPQYKPAMSNLVRLFEHRELPELAEEYRGRIRRHQERNPFHHYAQAETAHASGQHDEALAAVDRALRLRRDEHIFHFLRARILASTGRLEDSRASLERARQHALLDPAKAMYDRKLEGLQSRSSR